MTGSEGKKPNGTLGRRQLVRAAAAFCVFGAASSACGPRASGAGAPGAQPVRASPTSSRKPGSYRGPVQVHSWFDFPTEARSRELSGIVWDDATRTLWAVQDESANIVSIVPDAALRSWTLGPVIPLKMNFPLDLEGIVMARDGFIVASEMGPRILEVDRQGNLRRDIALPKHFAEARDNKSLESLTMTPDQAYLFTTTEAALRCDEDDASQSPSRARLRILRLTCATGEISEHAYATELSPHGTGEYGVADMAALGMEDLLVLERGWARGHGNSARIYRASLDDPQTSCTATPALASNAPVVRKELFVDFATLEASGLPAAKQRQDSPLLDNYEGITIGPRLPDGRDTLVLVSDDNGRSDQFARIVVLAVG